VPSIATTSTIAAVRRQRQQPGQRDVVQVVAGRMRQRATLAPTGHAAIHQLWIARRALGRPETQALHDAGAVALDQRVGLGHELERLRDAGRLLQVDHHRLLAAPQRVIGAAAEPLTHREPAGPHDQRHRRAHVGQHAAGQRSGTEAFEFDDVQAGQRWIHPAVS
jgi:hypothetical protein